MIKSDLEKVRKFVVDILTPFENEIKELQDSRKESVEEFCTANDIEKKEFNEAWRRAKKDVSDEVDIIALAMNGLMPDSDE